MTTTTTTTTITMKAWILLSPLKWSDYIWMWLSLSEVYNKHHMAASGTLENSITHYGHFGSAHTLGSIGVGCLCWCYEACIRMCLFPMWVCITFYWVQLTTERSSQLGVFVCNGFTFVVCCLFAVALRLFSLFFSFRIINALGSVDVNEWVSECLWRADCLTNEMIIERPRD